MLRAMLSVLEIIKKTTDFFAAKGIENARFNAETIVGHALGLKRMQLYLQFERLLAESELEKIRPLVKRRSLREPLAYVLGEADFHGLKLKSDRRALIPRPETEELVELAVKSFADAPPPSRILDLGTGSGCIALALAAAFPLASVTAVDASEEALALAAENAASTGLATRVRLLRSDWYSGMPEGELFELIVANPPYLTAAETAETQPEVRAYEPATALTATDDGMADLRKIIEGTPRFLEPGGRIFIETGIAQHARLTEMITVAGFTGVQSKKDLSGRDRFVLGRR
jgi:release factor glutamine methyltransferase